MLFVNRTSWNADVDLVRNFLMCYYTGQEGLCWDNHLEAFCSGACQQLGENWRDSRVKLNVGTLDTTVSKIFSYYGHSDV